MKTQNHPYWDKKKYNGDTWFSFDCGNNSNFRIYKRPGLDDEFLIASKFEGRWMFIDPTMLCHELNKNMYWSNNILFSNETIISQQVKFSLSLKKNNGELMKLTNNAIKRFAKGQSFYGKIVVNMWLYKLKWGKTSEDYTFKTFDFVRNFNSPLVYENIYNYDCLSILTNKHFCSKCSKTEHYIYYIYKRHFITRATYKNEIIRIESSTYLDPYPDLKRLIQNIPVPENEHTINLKFEQNSCPICFNGYYDKNCKGLVLYPCEHAICITCDFELRTNSHSMSNYKCPQCRVKFDAYKDAKKFLNPDFSWV